MITPCRYFTFIIFVDVSKGTFVSNNSMAAPLGSPDMFGASSLESNNDQHLQSSGTCVHAITTIKRSEYPTAVSCWHK